MYISKYHVKYVLKTKNILHTSKTILSQNDKYVTLASNHPLTHDIH